MPPSVKSSVPAAAQVQITPIISKPIEVDIRMPRYTRPARRASSVWLCVTSGYVDNVRTS